jgi:hypothetical protein
MQAILAGVGISDIVMQPSGGNVGIGTASPTDKLQMNGGRAIFATSNFNGTNAGGSVFVFSDDNNGGKIWAQKDGNQSWGYLALQPNGGNVGIGTASPDEILRINGYSNGSSRLRLFNQGTELGALGSYSGYIGSGNANDLLLITPNNLAFGTNNTERMRITSDGYFKASNDGVYLGGNIHEFLANTANSYTLIVSNKSASPASTYIQDWRFTASTPNNSSARFWNCEDATANRAYMRSDGGLANFQSNDANLSDERTKKDISPLESYWDKFKDIQIVKFKYKDQTHDDYNIGVIAQQVESVAPEFVDVDGWGDKPELDEEGNEIVTEEEPLKSIYTADLYHATIKVLQEAMAKIEKLEAEIDSLKNQIK